MNKVVSVAAAALLLVTSVPAFAQQSLTVGGQRAGGHFGQGGGQLWRHPGGIRGGAGQNWRGGGARYGYRDGGGWRGHRGGGFGAGLAGLAAGAVIGGAIASQTPAYGYPDAGYPAYDPDYQDANAAPIVQDGVQGGGDTTAYCMNRFKSYDPSSGTYLGYDGERHPCP